jgi:hypothetical protein
MTSSGEIATSLVDAISTPSIGSAPAIRANQNLSDFTVT